MHSVIQDVLAVNAVVQFAVKLGRRKGKYRGLGIDTCSKTVETKYLTSRLRSCVVLLQLPSSIRTGGRGRTGKVFRGCAAVH